MIFVGGIIVGVIELKAQDSKNLDAIEAQAFGYHSSHTNSKYIIISNFDELRFYVDKRSNYEKFSLFHLSYDEFAKLHLLLSYESISSGLTMKLKEQSNTFEQHISKSLYRDYSAFRTNLFENIVKNNDSLVIPAQAGIHLDSPLQGNDQGTDKSTLLRLTQKLCDRLVFVLFAEDRGLLKANTIREIRAEFANQKFTDYTLYDIYKFYFDGIANGNEKLQIPKYNGGLFATDPMLDSLIIDDEMLDMEAQKLSDYDFLSDISVNILGHIFEQSLTDLEDMEKNLHNVGVSPSAYPNIEGNHGGIAPTINDISPLRKISKRKKDGIFYTPEYITRYIVENTLGKLCNEKKSELNIDEITPPKDSRQPTKAETKTKENLNLYREWLLALKIIDPACGSGAFLNQALEYLLREHKNLTQNLAIMGDLTAYYDIESSILEHNLYGVDINEDAVEIARLSLWLRTAVSGRTLTNLSDKIVCANSLLDFPFVNDDDNDCNDDGNVGAKYLSPTTRIKNTQSSWAKDISPLQFDVVIGNPPYGAKLVNNENKNYEIQSNESAILFMQLSNKLLKFGGIHSFIIPKPFVFSSTWESIRNKLKDDISHIIDCGKVWEEVKLEQVIYILRKDKKVSQYENLVLNSGDFLYIASIEKNLSNEFGFFVNGVNPNEIDIALKIKKDKASLLDLTIESNRGGMFQKEVKENGDIQVLGGMHIQRYEVRNFKGFIDANIEITQNSYLRENSVLVQEIIAHIQNPTDHIKITATILDNIQHYRIIDTIQQITLNCNFSNRYILSILHSTLINWYLYRFVFAKAIRTMHFSNQIIKKIPIPQISTEEQEPFINLVDEIMSAKESIKKYQKHIDSMSAIEKIEIKEAIEKLELRVGECEREIDNMVYNLYGLNSDEIRIVEG